MPSNEACELAALERKIANEKAKLARDMTKHALREQLQQPESHIYVKCGYPPFVPTPEQEENAKKKTTVCQDPFAEERARERKILDKLEANPALWNDEATMDDLYGWPLKKENDIDEDLLGDGKKPSQGATDLEGGKPSLRGASWVDHPLCPIRYGGPRISCYDCWTSDQAQQPVMRTCQICKRLGVFCSYSVEDPEMIRPCNNCNEHGRACISTKRPCGLTIRDDY